LSKTVCSVPFQDLNFTGGVLLYLHATTIVCFFGHYNWDINIEAESFVSENGRNTQDNCTQTESMETDTEDENPGLSCAIILSMFINVIITLECLGHVLHTYIH
jgi:hypothetical protein